ncbi:MAG TPA: hypothetical protein VEL03_19900 [Streptosporangiaceae bacterium]|nr:hypothetical protein [Streptosporangiaceae bacterium]
MTAEFKRLGKRGSYRLGRLRTQGVRVAAAPEPFRPSFKRSYRRGPASAWVLAAIAAVALIGAGTVIGWWFLPFVAGLAAGLANRVAGWSTATALQAVAAMAVAGWGIPLWWHVLDGQAYGAAARHIAVTNGLPRSAAAGLMLTLVVAIVQAVVGYWLGRAVTPRPAEI